MDRQTFEALPLENQVAYMNERPKQTLKQIAEEIGIPPSSLSQLFLKEGYVRKSGIYIKDDSKKEAEKETPADEWADLLKYKDQLIEMVLRGEQQEPPLDFSTLNDYKDESGKIQWSTLTFQIPAELHAELDDFLDRRGYKKQMLLSLVIKQFLSK